MARLPDLVKFAKKHKLKLGTIEALIKFRRSREKLVERVEVIKMPTDYGDFQLHLYRATTDGQNHLALVKGDVTNKKKVLVRVHSECLTGDVFGSRRCDCGPQLHQAMKQIADDGCEIAASHIDVDEGREPSVLAADHGGAIGNLDPSIQMLDPVVREKVRRKQGLGMSWRWPPRWRNSRCAPS